MGNISYFIPTKNKEEFYVPDEDIIRGIANFLKTSLDDRFRVVDNEMGDVIVIRNSDQAFIKDFFVDNMLLLYPEHDLSELKRMGFDSLASSYENLLGHYPELQLDKGFYTVGAKHSPEEVFNDDPKWVESILHEYFGLCIFDEGIHPEFIPPEHEYKFYKSEPFFEKFKRLIN